MQNECPCKKMVAIMESNDSLSEAVHQMAHELELYRAQHGDERGIRRVYMKAYYVDSLIGQLISRFTWSKDSRKRKICHVSTLIYGKTVDVGVKELWEIESTSKDDVHDHPHIHDAREGEYYFMDVTIEQYKDIVARAKSIVGCKYDRIGNLGFVLRRRIEDKSKWFCSESQAWAFWNSAPLSRKPPYKETPYDCATSIRWTPCGKEEVHI